MFPPIRWGDDQKKRFDWHKSCCKNPLKNGFCQILPIISIKGCVKMVYIQSQILEKPDAHRAFDVSIMSKKV